MESTRGGKSGIPDASGAAKCTLRWGRVVDMSGVVGSLSELLGDIKVQKYDVMEEDMSNIFSPRDFEALSSSLLSFFVTMK
jgi:hypothetical protein